MLNNEEVQVKLAPLLKEETGLAVAVVKRGEVEWTHLSGYASLEHRVPVTEKTVFPLASVSKQFTAMVTMILAEEGKIGYEDNIWTWFPELKWAKSITVRHLLQQISGIPDPYQWYTQQGKSWYGLTNIDVLNYLRAQTHGDFPVGEKFNYSNSNYVLLAMMAEKVLGVPFRKVLEENLFKPLGMSNTLLYDARYVIPNRAYGYLSENGHYRCVDIQWLGYGDGGIMTTLEDFLKWDLALTQGKLVSEDSYLQAFSPGKANSGEPTSYGFGWAIDTTRPNKVLWHSGGDPGFGSIYLRVPNQEFSIVMLSNLDESWKQFGEICRDIG